MMRCMFLFAVCAACAVYGIFADYHSAAVALWAFGAGTWLAMASQDTD